MAQVIPFLTHPEVDVREYAVRILSSVADLAPATAEDFWRVLDAAGLDQAMRDPDFMAPHVLALMHLADLPQTDASLRRTLAELAQRGTEEQRSRFLLEVLRQLALPQLQAHQAEILALPTLPADDRADLQERLALANQSPDELWAWFEANAMVFDEKQQARLIARYNRVVEALAQHPEFAAPRAMAWLQQPSREDWGEIYAIELLGRLRHVPAADLILDRLNGDGDYVLEAAQEALGRIGTAEVVHKIAARFAKGSWTFRLYACGALEHIRSAETEAVLLQLLPRESDLGIRSSIMSALLLLASAAALPQLRHYANTKGFERMTVDLERDILTVGQMVGYTPPEAAAWRKEIAAREQRRRRQRQAFERAEKAVDAAALQQLTAEGMRELGGLSPGGTPLAETDADDEYTVPEALVGEETFVHNTAKLGRNDPCPCGSGKKYKKCCGK